MDYPPLTVSQLIELLKKRGPDEIVFIEHCDGVSEAGGVDEFRNGDDPVATLIHGSC